MPATASASPNPLRTHARVLIAALVGTGVEFFDFYIFATAAALVFGPMFFPKSDPVAQLIFVFMINGVAFAARPLGAMFFGHFGDRVGRKSTLVASLLLMGAATFAVALLPSYHTLEPWGLGWLAPALLCVLRFAQGFAVGGEWGGAALLAVENAPPGWESRFGVAPQLGAPVGFLCSTALFLVLGRVLSPADFTAWGWRVPFVASAVLVAVGLWVRLKVGETAAFSHALEDEALHDMPIGPLFAQHGRALLAGTCGALACFATFYFATTFALAQATGPLHLSREPFLLAQLGANMFFGASLVIAAVWCDRAGAARVLACGAAMAVVLGLGFGAGLGSGSMGVVFLTLSAALATMGFVYAPLSAWLSSLFPVNLRYSGISLAFAAGGVGGGALAPIAATRIAAMGHLGLAGALLSLAGVLTLAGLALAPARLRPAAAG